MHGLVSLLPEPYYEQVEAIWDMLERDCGLVGIRVTPYPHFSWQIAQEYDFAQLEEILHDLVRDTVPIVVRTSGIGVFTGRRPVIYINVVKSAQVLALHEKVWEATQAVAIGVSPSYHPHAWMPHVSLAYEDVTHANVAPVIGRLAFENYSWEMTINSISVIYEPAGEVGDLRLNMEFQGEQ